ncbi:hypothetical protein BL254_09325 [Protofrankia sp. BMG5.30]|uniref:Uncharacterized protein n=1 Tax=Protofrankia coriariae TaxID=1562887 RepID=A0ABR5F376_9ACTN|nr:hypothetical protein FrCorBMG51_13090 [Protofrankia coriariae]ONH35833.1 hypothetical protein BL254_09325 [Protofrankia sp. BMG5.30]
MSRKPGSRDRRPPGDTPPVRPAGRPITVRRAVRRLRRAPAATSADPHERRSTGYDLPAGRDQRLE